MFPGVGDGLRKSAIEKKRRPAYMVRDVFMCKKSGDLAYLFSAIFMVLLKVRPDSAPTMLMVVM
jgi:hypothetical protein